MTRYYVYLYGLLYNENNNSNYNIQYKKYNRKNRKNIKILKLFQIGLKCAHINSQKLSSKLLSQE